MLGMVIVFIVCSDYNVVRHENGLQNVHKIESEEFVPFVVQSVVNCLVKVRALEEVC